MSELSPSQERHAYTTARSSVYKLLSIGFHYPAPSIFEIFKNGEFLAELWDCISYLPYSEIIQAEKAELTLTAQRSMEGITSTDFEVTFVQTFDTGMPLPPCPPYEGAYRGETRTSILLEVYEFYKYFGLQMSQREDKREFPDHLCAELEFLHFLTFKEAQATGDGNKEFLKGYVLAQKDFLERHLILWVPKFYDRLQRISRIPLYPQLARVLSLFIAQDIEWVVSNRFCMIPPVP